MKLTINNNQVELHAENTQESIVLFSFYGTQKDARNVIAPVYSKIGKTTVIVGNEVGYMIDLFKQGKSRNKVAKMTGHSWTTVARVYDDYLKGTTSGDVLVTKRLKNYNDMPANERQAIYGRFERGEKLHSIANETRHAYRTIRKMHYDYLTAKDKPQEVQQPGYRTMISSVLS